MRRLAVAAVVSSVVCGAALAGCRSDRSTVSSGASNTTASTAPVTTTALVPPLTGGSTTPVSTPAQGSAKLVAVAVTNEGSFDKVAFEFQGGVPGYSVAYTPRPIQEDASGKEVAVAG